MLSYSTQLAHLTYTVGGGYNKIERDDASFDDANGYTAKIAVDYIETGYSWGGSVVRQLTDSAIGLSGFEMSIANFSASDGNVDEFDIVESTQADLHGSRQVGTSSQINGSVGYVLQDYEETPRDEKTYFAQLGYHYTINTRWSVGLDARYEDSQFTDDPNDLRQKDKIINATLNHQYSERLTSSVVVGRKERDANVSGREYIDNYVMLNASFRFY